MTLTTRCLCPGAGSYRIDVQDGRVTAVEPLDEQSRSFPAQPEFSLTVTELLDLAGNARWQEVRAEYDSTYGFPRMLELDEHLDAVDDELSYYIDDFSPTD
jgi:hypothetical protein